MFHTAGQIITTGRRRLCRLSNTWPWTRDLVDAFARLDTIHLDKLKFPKPEGRFRGRAYHVTNPLLNSLG